MRHIKQSVLALALLLIFPLCAQAFPGNASGGAQPGTAPSPETRFKNMDADQDGKVSREEFMRAFPNMREQAFVSLDADQDGFLSLEEWLSFSGGHSKNMSGPLPPPQERTSGTLSTPQGGNLLDLLPPEERPAPGPEGKPLPLLAPEGAKQ